MSRINIAIEATGRTGAKATGTEALPNVPVVHVSNNTAVATADDTGKVTGVAGGSCQIQASDPSNNLTALGTVTVGPQAASVALTFTTP
jgi:uncharacterized protein YjdB